MLASFLTFINDNKIPLSDERIILAISGGVDSVVMADLFSKAGFNAVFAHVNFSLRGEESEADELFVKELAHSYNFPFFSFHPNTREFARTHGISIQMAARDLRYKWFEELRKIESATFIATAHHADDSFETALLNLVRGTGISGLKGIAPLSGKLIRPLLFASRKQIMDYAMDNHLTWREDRSNKSNNYKRNLLRNEVIPILQKLNPSLSKTFVTSSKRIHAANALVSEELEKWKTKFVQTTTEGLLYISIKGLLNSSEPSLRLFSVLEEYNFSYKKTLGIISALSSQPGTKFISSTHTLVIDREHLIVSSTEFPEKTVIIPYTDTRISTSSLSIEIHSSQITPGSSPTTSTNKADFDTATLNFPLQIRPWQSGDRFFPLGMKGKQKNVSDLLTDKKIPYTQKKQVLVLTDQTDRIIWVIGHRLDERFKVTDNTLSITTLQINHY
jgi:tRNA(Ile)-lysidine synthase